MAVHQAVVAFQHALLDGAIWWVLDQRGELSVARYSENEWQLIGTAAWAADADIIPVQPCVAPTAHALNAANDAMLQARQGAA